MKNVSELPEHTKINNHAIKLEESKQPPFESIYSQGLVELETLKTYIKANLANSFIQLFKSRIRAPILFNQKPDVSLCLYVDNWGLYNIIIKNQYLLPLIGESLNRISRARKFT